MNKKGLLPLILAIIAVVIVSSLIGIKLFAEVNLFTITGIGIIALTLIYVAPAALNDNLNNKKITFVVILLFIGAFLIFTPKLFQMSSYPEYIERPVFKYVKCEMCNQLITSTAYTAAVGGSWNTKPTVTDEYTVRVFIPDSDATRRLNYKVCDTADKTKCSLSTTKTLTMTNDAYFDIPNIRYTESVFLDYEEYALLKLKYVDKSITYKLFFQQYCLREYNVLGGSAIPINSNDCKVNYVSNDLISTDIQKLLTEVDSKGSDLNQQTSELLFDPNEVRWYLAGYVSSAAPSFKLTYNGVDAWCRQVGNDALIYKINKVSSVSGTYKVASFDWSDLLDTKVNGCCLGNVLGDSVCQADFKYAKISDSSCSVFGDCGVPNYVPSGPKSVTKYSCINGKCVQEWKQVECASDYDCRLTNQVCDLSTYTCVKPNTNIEGDTYDDTGDGSSDKICEWYESLKQSQSVDSGILGWRKWIGAEKIVTTTECVTKPMYIIALLAVVFGGIIIILSLTMKPKRKRK